MRFVFIVTDLWFTVILLELYRTTELDFGLPRLLLVLLALWSPFFFFSTQNNVEVYLFIYLVSRKEIRSLRQLFSTIAVGITLWETHRVGGISPSTSTARTVLSTARTLFCLRFWHLNGLKYVNTCFTSKSEYNTDYESISRQSWNRPFQTSENV